MTGPTMTLRPTLLALLPVFALAACSNTSVVTGGEPDMGTTITFDLGEPDLGPEDLGVVDAGPGEPVVGGVCATSDDCGGRFECLSDPGLLPGGYCSAFCDGPDQCGDGAVCVGVGRGTAICVRECDPALEDACPRAGYGCGDGVNVPSVCLGGCEQDTDCEDGLSCSRFGGNGFGACFDADASIGDACGATEECPAGAFCLGEGFAGWPGGSCIGATGCDPGTNAGCTGDARCTVFAGFGAFCLDGCTADADCRDGYACVEAASGNVCQPACEGDTVCSGGRACNPALGTCAAPFDAGRYDVPCSAGRGGCDGGTCFSEGASGFPDSACVYTGCDASAADGDDGCPGDGVCVDDGGLGFCVAGCDDASECRSGYACRTPDGDAASGTGCLPGCASDAVCVNDGFACNSGTGLCTVPFADAAFGEPCDDGGECPGGRCFTELGDGWPAGTCASLGCRLSGDGPESACPAGGVCVDDGVGDPAIGLCLTACASGASGTCRAGYGCEAVEGGADGEGACRPACTETDCSTGTACDVASGFCLPEGDAPEA
ncbi:MAG: hypothetical protein AAF447_03875 [Myxococcota bacterium]